MDDNKSQKPKKERNVDILIPFKNEMMIPDYLIDFIQNDPNFVPEIHCNNLEDVFFDIYQGPNDTSEL